jgi:hemerythrin-like domain-containing protein
LLFFEVGGYDRAMLNCCDLLIAEHRQTEALLAALETKVNLAVGVNGLDASGWHSLEADYMLFARDLNRHFLLEEMAVFALLSQYRSMMLMTVEHDDLLTLQHAFARELSQNRQAQKATDSLMLAFNAFKIRLLAHIVEEERGIFPLANAKLEPEEQQKALRVYQALRQMDDFSLPSLPRTVPAYEMKSTRLFQPVEKPLAYESLYEREHASVQHLQMKAGMKQAPHWVGQHQCLVLISGEVALEFADEVTFMLPGQTVSIDSRLYFALRALTDAHLLVFKVWPHPHYVKGGQIERSGSG